jgi:HNH endonuclease
VNEGVCPCGNPVHRKPGARGPVSSKCATCKTAPRFNDRQCRFCQGAFQPYKDDQYLCSPCSKRNRRGSRWIRRRCLLCDDVDLTLTHRQKWCAPCAERVQRQRVIEKSKNKTFPMSSRCMFCTKEFTKIHPSHKTCSVTCNRRSQNQSPSRIARRQLYKSLNTGPVSRISIYERDHWVCGLCSIPVDRHILYPDPQSASLDHVMPLSKGGTNDPENLQLAHLGCNKAKKDRVIPLDKAVR